MTTKETIDELEQIKYHNTKLTGRKTVGVTINGVYYSCDEKTTNSIINNLLKYYKKQ